LQRMLAALPILSVAAKACLGTRFERGCAVGVRLTSYHRPNPENCEPCCCSGSIGRHDPAAPFFGATERGRGCSRHFPYRRCHSVAGDSAKPRTRIRGIRIAGVGRAFWQLCLRDSLWRGGENRNSPYCSGLARPRDALALVRNSRKFSSGVIGISNRQNYRACRKVR
jgi:hypothetical protein